MSGVNEEDKQRGGRSEEDRVIHYLVNGERQRTEEATLSVKEILCHAGCAAGIDLNDLNDYYLENMTNSRQYKDPDDQVSLRDGDQFLAVYSGRTVVA